MTQSRPARQAIEVSLLNPEAYQPYGEVIMARPEVAPVSANLGTARRYNQLASLKNLRPGVAEANVCLFFSQPMVKLSDVAFKIGVLERHAQSTQVFIPTHGVSQGTHYLVIVCGSEISGRPDLTTLRAFVAHRSQGISYFPGIWHHPLVAIQDPMNFACVVFEEGTEADCDIVNFDPSLPVDLANLTPFVRRSP